MIFSCLSIPFVFGGPSRFCWTTETTGKIRKHSNRQEYLVQFLWTSGTKRVQLCRPLFAGEIIWFLKWEVIRSPYAPWWEQWRSVRWGNKSSSAKALTNGRVKATGCATATQRQREEEEYGTVPYLVRIRSEEWGVVVVCQQSTVILKKPKLKSCFDILITSFHVHGFRFWL